ncbi:MAG: S49 family peptidase [Phycisphaerae bacterium]|nr:S49 family peptidase [Phycisphaerae bacterium]
MTAIPPAPPTPPVQPNNSLPPAAEPVPVYAQPAWPAAPKKPSPVWKIFRYLLGLLLFFSIVMNLYLMVLLSAITGMGMQTSVIKEGDKSQIVAVYSVAGVINNELAAKFHQFYGSIRDNNNVKAVVLYVDSPGGTVAASERIHYMIKDLKTAGKTVVVSMGGVAASGGYLISAPAEEIFAEPATITGSIGVIAQVPNIQGSMEKIGVKMMVFKSTHAQVWKDSLSLFREPQDLEKKRMIEILDSIQASFEQTVKDGRGNRLKTKTESYKITVGEGKQAKTVQVKEIAPFNGKIYLAGEAKTMGLIDKIGFLDDATKRAGELAQLGNPQVVRYATQVSVLDRLLDAKTTPLEIAPQVIDKFQTPRILMIWKME